ncbi:unnamed protein product [Clonostachys chloroleuca]|uniref:Uncharacterized protein n=1 Tax=Clonostachys chloroleuca TaxID=1926264 RepID=A0AA35LPE3_9HYPO|nr:unnamed protein product [Clonostachys chloroleuca]
MVAPKQLSLAALIWLGLASQGLALQVDQASNDLTLVERAEAPSGKLGVALAPNQKLPKVGSAHKADKSEKAGKGGKLGVALASNQKTPKSGKHHKAGKHTTSAASGKKAHKSGKLSAALAPESKPEHKERDLEERKITAKGVAKGVGKVAKGALRLLFRDLEARDVDELSERDLEELIARYYDEEELAARDLEERKITAKGVAKGVGKVAKGALRLLFRDVEARDVDELSERDLEELIARYYDEAEELAARDLEERKISAKGVAKGIGKVAKGALNLLLRDIEERDIDELEERDLEELVERYFDEEELTARYFDETELDERDLEERKITAKGVAKGVGKVAKGALKLFFRDLEEIEERDFEELSERDLDELEERDLEERKITAKGVAKGVGKVAKGALKLFFRDLDALDERDLEEFDERDIEELAARYFDDSDIEERDLEERKITAKGVAKGVGKVAKGALKLLFRDLSEREDLDERDIDELFARHFDEEELAARFFDETEIDERDLEERKITAKGVAKGVGKVAKGALRLLFRDVEERDFEDGLAERDMSDLVTRYFDDSELVLESRMVRAGFNRGPARQPGRMSIA